MKTERGRDEDKRNNKFYRKNNIQEKEKFRDKKSMKKIYKRNSLQKEIT